MTIRQDYIDNFKTYCKINGYKEYDNKTEYLFTCIQNTLNNLGYYESTTIDKANNQVKQYFMYLKPYHPIIKGIITTEQSFTTIYTSPNYTTKNWSWIIGKSKKLHNNTTMLCYLMRNLLTK